MIEGVLLDLSGVVYTGDEPIPSAIDAIKRLRDSGLPIRFLTNTTRTPKAKLLSKLRSLGIDVSEAELFTPAAAARCWLDQHRRSPHLLIHRELTADFEGLATFEQIAVLVGDAGTDFTYQSLNAAFRKLQAGAELVALASNRVFRDEDGDLSLDAGPFVEALSFAARKQPVVLGKPSRDFFVAAAQSIGCQLSHTVMVGDDAETDVAGALSAGVGQALLVQTGKYQRGIEDQVSPAPTAIVEDLGKAADWIGDRLD